MKIYLYHYLIYDLENDYDFDGSNTINKFSMKEDLEILLLIVLIVGYLK